MKIQMQRMPEVVSKHAKEFIDQENANITNEGMAFLSNQRWPTIESAMFLQQLIRLAIRGYGAKILEPGILEAAYDRRFGTDPAFD